MRPREQAAWIAASDRRVVGKAHRYLWNAETWTPTEASGVQQPAMEAEHLTRALSGTALVNDISVQIQPGEVVAIVGPSGSGKSSFLRLLNRLDEPTGGIVLINGEDFRELAPQELRRRVGMVMQIAYLFPWTVAENVAFEPWQRGKRFPQNKWRRCFSGSVCLVVINET